MESTKERSGKGSTSSSLTPIQERAPLKLNDEGRDSDDSKKGRGKKSLTPQQSQRGGGSSRKESPSRRKTKQGDGTTEAEPSARGMPLQGATLREDKSKAKRSARFASRGDGLERERVDEASPMTYSVYEGERNAQGEAEGHGFGQYPNGDEYLGQWVANKREGEGSCTFATGEVRHGNHPCAHWRLPCVRSSVALPAPCSP